MRLHKRQGPQEGATCEAKKMAENSNNQRGYKPLFALIWELIGVAIVLLVGWVLLSSLFATVSQKRAKMEAARKAAESQREVPAVPIVVKKLATTTVVDEINLPGRIEAIREVAVSTEVRGKVIELEVIDGQLVDAGQVVLRLDDSDYRIALADAKARLKLAAETLRSTKELVQSRVETKYEMDKAQSGYDQAVAAVNRAKLQVERCILRSPIKGVVDDVEPDLGEFVASEKTVAVVLEVNKLKVEIGIPEKDVHEVRAVKECEVTIDAISLDHKVMGKVVYLSHQPAKNALVYLLRLEIDNSDNLLRPGMFGRARIVKAKRENSVVAPLFSIMAIRDDHVAYVVDKDVKQGQVTTVKKRAVELGTMTGRSVEITKGLKAGEHLVVVGQRSVADDTKVRVMRIIDKMGGMKR